jgi:hypothetical protein
MKILILICFAFLAQFGKDNNEEFEPYFFRNNFSDDAYVEANFFSIFQIGDIRGDITDIPLKNLDTNLFKGKKLGFIISDLSSKYMNFWGFSFNGVLGYGNVDLTKRTHFAFNFKYNDTLGLDIVGMLAKSAWFNEASDSLAINRIYEIDKYIILPVLRDMKASYTKIIERMKTNNSPMLKEQLENILKTYPEVAK